MLFSAQPLLFFCQARGCPMRYLISNTVTRSLLHPVLLCYAPATSQGLNAVPPAECISWLLPSFPGGFQWLTPFLQRQELTQFAWSILKSPGLIHSLWRQWTFCCQFWSCWCRYHKRPLWLLKEVQALLQLSSHVAEAHTTDLLSLSITALHRQKHPSGARPSKGNTVRAFTEEWQLMA